MFVCLQVAAFSRRVLFTAAAAAVPAGAVLLEVGPHSLLRGPLRQCADLGIMHHLIRGASHACCTHMRGSMLGVSDRHAQQAALRQPVSVKPVISPEHCEERAKFCDPDRSKLKTLTVGPD